MTKPDDEHVRFTVEQIREGFELVSVENTGSEPLTITSVGIWLTALSMGYDFGPGRISKDHPHPGFPATLAPGETVTYPINVGDIYEALKAKQDRLTDFAYFATTECNPHHVSAPMSVLAYLLALDPNPIAPKTPPFDGVFQT